MKKMNSLMHRLSKQAGASLVEVLVAVVVVSVGLVGLAALQTVSMRNNQSAYLRTQATFLTYDILDRMRANSAAAQSGQYVTTLGADPNGTANCEATNCVSADMATFDVNQWKCQLGAWDNDSVCSATLSLTGQLPGGDGSITQNGNIHTVSVSWQDRDGTQTTFQVSTEL